MNNELLLYDRIENIKLINKKYNLENNSYISFSGGKDSTILHYLIDIALPKNNIPRVFINTGIEYNDIILYVKELQKKDNRIIIINSNQNIINTLKKYGYPFKSKQHSHNVAIYQNNFNKPYNLSLQRYLGIIESNTLFKCPKQLKYQFENNYNKIKISDKCCTKLKKEPILKWEKENNKNIKILGLRQGEGGQRASHKGCIIIKDNNLTTYKPLNPINNDFIEWFIKKYNIKLCKLYYEPFNFKRTGCKGCPFNLDLQEQLNIMEKLLPNDYKQCEIIWKPIYNEYRNINYRLKNNIQLKLDI